MPELPEVETVKRVLLPIVKGRTIKGVDILRKSIVNNLEEEFISFIKNETVLDMSRIGKFLIFHLTNEKVLISHLRMEGKYIELLENEDNTKYARVVFHLDNGHKLCYDDSRSFGRMIMSNEKDYLNEKEIAKLGPEPFIVDDVKPLLEKAKRISLPIKTALLSQELITGLGNIYVDEVLFASKIHPLTPAKLTTFCPHCQIKRGAPLKIAIVGKIASGKSTVLEEFKKANSCCLSSDQIVHELYAKNEVQNLIIKKLKIKEDGEFVAVLRNHIAHNPKDLDKLEKIVHPLVKKEIESNFKKSKAKLLVAEVPLLFKAHMQNMFDVIVGIDIDEKIQIERLELRDKEKSALLKRINDENNLFEEHRSELDFIVNNNDNLACLRKEVRSVICKVEDRLNPLPLHTSL